MIIGLHDSIFIAPDFILDTLPWLMNTNTDKIYPNTRNSPMDLATYATLAIVPAY